MSQAIPQSEIDSFLERGQYDPLYLRFPGTNHLDRMKGGRRALAEALSAEVRLRESAVDAQIHHGLPTDLRAFTRSKVDAMVRGLFRRDECEAVLSILENSVVFLTPDNVHDLIQNETPNTAWTIASIYLRSVGADPVSDEAPNIVGLSVDTTCYVSMDYFREDDPFADYVVHETAHVFHNTKRRIAGLKETRRNVWLLPIEFQKRETFAYACEAYSRIRERAERPADRRMLFEELQDSPPPSDERVDASEYWAVLSEAVNRRNGWKAILERCSAKP